MTEDEERGFREDVTNALNITLKGLMAIYGDNEEVLESIKLAMATILDDFDHLYPY